MRDSILEQVFTPKGAAKRIAGELGITEQAIGQWDRVPPLRVLEFCRVTGLKPHEVRPDLYPAPDEVETETAA